MLLTVSIVLSFRLLVVVAVVVVVVVVVAVGSFHCYDEVFYVNYFVF
jgi:hypothetical protein